MSDDEFWVPPSEWRPLSKSERALLLAMTGQEFPGSEALRRQVEHASAQQGCGCGCGTINLTVDKNLSSAVEFARQPTPGEAEVLDPAGKSVGGLILFARDGYLSCLEIYTWTDPLPLPRLDAIRPYVNEA